LELEGGAPNSGCRRSRVSSVRSHSGAPPNWTIVQAEHLLIQLTQQQSWRKNRCAGISGAVM